MDYITYIRSLVGTNKIVLNAAAAIITDHNHRILLQLRGDDHTWGLPGGIMELGETLEETCVREVFEETGLHITIDRLLGPYYNRNKVWPNGDQAHVICFVYHAQVSRGSLTIDGDETLDLKYFKYSELPEIGAVDHKQAIDDFFGTNE
ncbi:NUDIX hydrolase [Candidatus Xianfuyuplasma coldseepsis]|uniref:NUDIX domain-containing protein n=1 Tax=Candidatus Xianfuyuplasma coldseepsis TaxID=2782163 RepID=A0A7L7KS01_9MOLU|nr:NUDIX domain-containing protein [Xianfuyuplasma coldseepsis]QMS84578.1 NUDIX domain-containing protein [Xianfuyuplasma coldseepsis]